MGDKPVEANSAWVSARTLEDIHETNFGPN